MYTCIYFNHVTRLSLFDTYVGNVSSYMYASEVLEFHKGDVIEKNTFGIC